MNGEWSEGTSGFGFVELCEVGLNRDERRDASRFVVLSRYSPGKRPIKTSRIIINRGSENGSP
jgi:hypothetical protein